MGANQSGEADLPPTSSNKPVRRFGGQTVPDLGGPEAVRAMDRRLRQNKPRLLLMGQRRSGKSSITSVVFHKMQPQETLFLESTTRIQKDTMESFMDFQVWDFPGQLDYFDPAFDTTEIFSEIGALVWVIDAQDEYSESLNRLTTSIMNLQTTFPHINVEVFVHKTDSLNDEYKADIFQDIVQKVGDDLNDAGYINPNVSYHLTSIYDHTIFEAFSKVVQKLIPELDAFQNLLNTLVERSGMTKAYLFDIQSKIYVASDTRPIDMNTYEMASSFIDVVVDIIDLYTYERKNPIKLGDQKQETEASITFDHVNSMVYLMEMNRYLVLVAEIQHDKAKDKKGLIDYNAHVFQDALTEVLARRWESQGQDNRKDVSAVQAGEEQTKKLIPKRKKVRLVSVQVMALLSVLEFVTLEIAPRQSTTSRVTTFFEMDTMTTTFMHNSTVDEAKSRVNLVGDTDKISESGSKQTKQAQPTATKIDSARKATNPRVQVLRLASVARRDTRGIPGATPPFLPSAPSLLRFDQAEESIVVGTREPSPLRNLALPNYPTKRMPHAVSMPQSGFQALILCGPGIGLNTFTSVPSEFPKALVEIANRPMVWYVLDWCYRMGVTDITLITPPASKTTVAAALAQNPYLTSLPSPTPDLIAPADLEHTTPTAELLRLPEVQQAIISDFLLLPCDLVCDISGETFLETYLTGLAGIGGAGIRSSSDLDTQKSSTAGLGGEKSGRRGGLSVWYNTVNREESVKGEECDFMCTANLDPENASPFPLLKGAKMTAHMRKLVWTMPMSELWDQAEEDKSWKIRQSLLRKHGNIKCMTQYRDSHIYLLPYWIKDFARLNTDFESVSEDLVGTWAKSDWRKPAYRSRLNAEKIFRSEPDVADDQTLNERPIEDEIDILSLSSTQVARHPIIPSQETPQQKRTAQLASRVHAAPEASILSADSDLPASPNVSTRIPAIPPILAYILPSQTSTPLVRRVDTTPLLLSVSLLLAKLPSIEDLITSKQISPSPFAHSSKIHPTATVAPRVTISRSDTLIGANTTIATQCVVKNSVIGANVSLGAGVRVTGSVIMDGSVVGEKSVVTGTVVGKKVKIGKGAGLTGCEVQDGNVLGDGVEGKGEKYLVGGLEDEVDGLDFDDEEEGDGRDLEKQDDDDE